MTKKYFSSFVAMLLLSLALCSNGFAVEIADGVTHDPLMSQMALTMVLQQFEAAKAQLTQMADTATPDQKAAIEGLIAKLEQDKIDKIENIDVYLADENTSGEAYDELRAFYEAELSGMRDVDPQEALDKLPAGTQIPPDTKKALEDLIAAGKVKAAYGTSGKFRVSISTVYLDPQNNYALAEGTVLIIGKEK